MPFYFVCCCCCCCFEPPVGSKHSSPRSDEVGTCVCVCTPKTVIRLHFFQYHVHFVKFLLYFSVIVGTGTEWKIDTVV